MCGLGQSSGWARQSAREQSLWRNYMQFSQMAPPRLDSSSISDHTTMAKTRLSEAELTEKIARALN
jgi:hypothetical protein